MQKARAKKVKKYMFAKLVEHVTNNVAEYHNLKLILYIHCLKVSNFSLMNIANIREYKTRDEVSVENPNCQ